MDILRSKKKKPPRLSVTSLHRTPIAPRPSLSASRSERSAPGTTALMPRAIPQDKFEGAINKFRQILAARAAEALAARDTTPLAAHPTYLSVPPSGSTTSRYSASVSEHDAATERSSVMSFQENEEPSQSNLVSYTGEVVSQPKRKRFHPVQRLETDLVRYLGPCPHNCSGRSVRCQLDKHHDVAALQREITRRDSRKVSGNLHQLSSSISGGSQGMVRSSSGSQSTILPASQDDFLGVGAQLPMPTAYGVPQQEVQSPGADVLAGITLGSSFTNVRSQPQMGLNLGTEQYAQYGHGAIILIGVQLGQDFYCRHESGCVKYFQDLEALQSHFESDHFHYTRIHPAIQHVCSACHQVNECAWIRCSSCNLHGYIQTRIHGHFIRDPEYFYDPDNGPARIPLDSSSSPYFYSAYAASVTDAEAGPGSYDDFGNEYNPGPFVEQDSNPYGGPSNQGYGYDGMDDTHMEGSFFHGSFYGSARQLAFKHSVLRVLYSNVRRHSQRLKHLLFILLSLIAIIIFLTHDELISQAQNAFPQAGPEIREHLPTIGFIVLFISFGASFVVKHRIQQPPSSPPAQAGHCSLRALAPYAKQSRRSASGRYVGCSERS